jgi:hypothetical protein
MKEFLDAISADTHKQLMKPINDELKAYAELIPGVGAAFNKSGVLRVLRMYSVYQLKGGLTY